MMNETCKELPQTICGCCIRKLKSANAFVQQAHEVNDKLWSMLNETNNEDDSDDDKPINCLQEAQIDIQDCLEIKMENEEDTGEDKKQEIEELKVKLKKEEPEECNIDLSTAIDKLSTTKKDKKDT